MKSGADIPVCHSAKPNQHEPRNPLMLELLHAVITSLLLSTAMGGGVDTSATTDEEPANSETGVDVGKMPSHLVSQRTNNSDTQQDDHQPSALSEQVSFCEPAVWAPRPIASIQSLPQGVCPRFSGRSP